MNTLMKSLVAATASMTVSLAFAVDPFTPANALNPQKAPHNAFSGAFLEINTGLVGNHAKSATSQDTINYTVNFGWDRIDATATGTRSTSGGEGGGEGG